jgi:hypothetical protein
MIQRSKVCFVGALALLAAAGCGEASEDIAGVQAAVGSAWATPVGISTLQGLKTMDPVGSYYLKNDIDGGNATWTPPASFMGTLDGRGKTIKKLKINDTRGRAGAFFESTQNALIKNIRFTEMTVSGTNIAAGVVGVASDSSLDQVGFQGTVNGGVEAGGLVGRLYGGSITRSYMKGTVSGATSEIGGLVADARGMVAVSYAQATVTGNTTNASPSAGGVVGVLSDGGDVHDVYAVGNVKGRGYVGGVVGLATCSDGYTYFMYNGIYRGGDVVDANRNGWSGGIGFAKSCTPAERWGALFYDTTADTSGTHNTTYVGNYGHSAKELRDPTAPDGGVFCKWTPQAGHCLDNGFADPPWNAGTKDQHHTLRGVLDESSQPLL